MKLRDFLCKPKIGAVKLLKAVFKIYALKKSTNRETTSKADLRILHLFDHGSLTGFWYFHTEFLFLLFSKERERYARNDNLNSLRMPATYIV